MKRILLLVMSIMVLFSCTVFAQKYDFKNENYNASGLKSVIVIASIPDQYASRVQDPYALQKLINETCSKINKSTSVHAYTMDDIFQRIIKEKDADFPNTYQNNRELGNKELQDMVNEYDSVLVLTVAAFGLGEQYQGETSYNTTQNQTSTVIGPNGQVATVNTPVTTSHKIPGHMISNAAVEIDFTLKDAKNMTVIFDRKEARVRPADAFSTADPIDIAKRMISGYVEEMDNKIKHDAKH